MGRAWFWAAALFLWLIVVPSVVFGDWGLLSSGTWAFGAIWLGFRLIDAAVESL